MLYGGCIPATHHYMDWAIEQGKSVTLTPGGAREVQYAKENTNREVWLLRNRKGFLRFARRHGIPIVPLYTAGEQDAFTSAEGWLGRPLQWLSGVLRSVTGLTVDLNILQAFRPANLWKWSTVQNAEVPLTTTYVCEPVATVSADTASATASADAEGSADRQKGGRPRWRICRSGYCRLCRTPDSRLPSASVLAAFLYTRGLKGNYRGWGSISRACDSVNLAGSTTCRSPSCRCTSNRTGSSICRKFRLEGHAGSLS